MFAVKDARTGLPITISLQLFDHGKNDEATKHNARKLHGVVEKLEMEIAKFHTGKGPPPIAY